MSSIETSEAPEVTPEVESETDSTEETTEEETTPEETPEERKARLASTQYGSVAIAELADKESDGSHITDPKAVGEMFAGAIVKIGQWIDAYRTTKGLSQWWVEESHRMRVFFLNSRGAIDFGGESPAYKSAVTDRIWPIFEVAYDGDREEYDAFLNRARVWNSQNDYTRKFMAEYLLAHDATGKLAEGTTRDPSTGTITPGNALATALRAEAKKQRDSRGNVPEMFKPEKFAVTSGKALGLPISKRGKTTDQRTGAAGTGNASGTTAKAQWEALLHLLAKVNGEGENASPAESFDVTFDYLHQMGTVSFDVLFGAVGQPSPLQAVKNPATLAEKADTLSALFREIANGLRDREKVNDEVKSAAHRYTAVAGK
jgi:hypothetical protein